MRLDEELVVSLMFAHINIAPSQSKNSQHLEFMEECWILAFSLTLLIQFT